MRWLRWGGRKLQAGRAKEDRHSSLQTGKLDRPSCFDQEQNT